MPRNTQKGIALILTLVLLLLISVIGVSLMFISQTETWSSLNYRLTSQARDAAEAGVNSAANYLMFKYASPASSGTDVLSSYNTAVSPVQYPSNFAFGHDVVLSAGAVSSNYPVGSVQTAFNTTGAGKGSLSPGNITVSYATSAKLLYMQQLGASLYLSSPATVQTWEITSDGTFSGVRTATEEVTAILEQQVVPVFGYAAFADSNGCTALDFGGGGATNSYNSGSSTAGVTPTTSNTDGNVGTNGNLSTNGSKTTINGTLSTPRTGVGTCSSNNVTAWSGNTGSVTGGLVQLPQTIVYPTPPAPNPLPGTISYTLNTGNCAGVVPNCTGTNTVYTLTGGSIVNGACSGTPTLIGNLALNGGATLHFGAGCYTVNSLIENGSASVVIDNGGPVLLNVAGTGFAAGATVVDLTGGSVTNASSWDPSTFQIIYAGNGNIKLNGGANAVGLMYAPNASYSFGGNGDWYGSVIGNTLTDMGGAKIHYDRRLKDKYYIPGPYMLNSFTWNKY